MRRKGGKAVRHRRTSDGLDALLSAALRLWAAATATCAVAVDELLVGIQGLYVWSVAAVSSLRHLADRWRLLTMRPLQTDWRSRHAAREHAVDRALRQAARRSVTAAPPSLTASIRLTLASTSIAPAPVSERERALTPLTRRLALVSHTLAEWLALGWSLALEAARRFELSEGKRRAALRSGALALVLVGGGLWLALSGSGLVGGALAGGLALGHLFSAAAAAIMESSVLALPAAILYVALVALWVYLVRSPVEA
jgi:hypothetical protein